MSTIAIPPASTATYTVSPATSKPRALPLSGVYTPSSSGAPHTTSPVLESPLSLPLLSPLVSPLPLVSAVDVLVVASLLDDSAVTDVLAVVVGSVDEVSAVSAVLVPSSSSVAGQATVSVVAASKQAVGRRGVMSKQYSVEPPTGPRECDGLSGDLSLSRPRCSMLDEG